MTNILAIAKTVMTLGILVGVWVGVLTTDKEMKDAIYKLNRFLKEKFDRDKGEP